MASPLQSVIRWQFSVSQGWGPISCSTGKRSSSGFPEVVSRIYLMAIGLKALSPYNLSGIHLSHGLKSACSSLSHGPIHRPSHKMAAYCYSKLAMEKESLLHKISP